MMLQIGSYQNAALRIYDAQRKLLASYQDGGGSNPLLETAGYALSAPGKMLRGMLLLEACRAVEGLPELLLSVAVSMEYGHLAGLIHDDVIDRDELRRGQPTVWKVYGDEAAIVCGDLFIFSTFHCLSQCRHLVPSERVALALEVLSFAGVELCLGQARETQLSAKCSTDPQPYLEMIRQKTGSLIRCSVEIGAVLGGGSEVQVSALRKYGESLGMAFQIVDDLLPYTSEERILCKPTTSDIKNRRITLPIIYALEDGSMAEREILHNIFENGALADTPDEAKETVMRILLRTGALERAKQEAIGYQRKALTQLAQLPENTGRAALAGMAELVVARSM